MEEIKVFVTLALVDDFRELPFFTGKITAFNLRRKKKVLAHKLGLLFSLGLPVPALPLRFKRILAVSRLNIVVRRAPPAIDALPAGGRGIGGRGFPCERKVLYG